MCRIDRSSPSVVGGKPVSDVIIAVNRAGRERRNQLMWPRNSWRVNVETTGAGRSGSEASRRNPPQYFTSRPRHRRGTRDIILTIVDTWGNADALRNHPVKIPSRPGKFSRRRRSSTLHFRRPFPFRRLGTRGRVLDDEPPARLASCRLSCPSVRSSVTKRDTLVESLGRRPEGRSCPAFLMSHARHPFFRSVTFATNTIPGRAKLSSIVYPTGIRSAKLEASSLGVYITI